MENSPKTKAELLQGTLDLLILKTLTAGPMHGYAIAQRIQHRSDDVLVRAADGRQRAERDRLP